VLSGAIKDAIDYIDAQGEKIDKLTTLNASLNEQNVSMAKDNTCLQAALGEAEWIIRLSKYKGEGPEEMQWGTRRWAFLDTPEAERGQKMAERLRDAEKYNCTDWVIDARDKQRKAEAEREDLRGRVEQLQVQLAGCLIAAEGATKDPAKQGDYGWSVCYQDVLDLRRKYDQLKSEGAEAAETAQEDTDECKHGYAFEVANGTFCPECGTLLGEAKERDGTDG